MTGSLKDRLCELLIKNRLVTESQLAKAIEIQKKEGRSLGKLLIEQGFLSEKDFLSMLSQEIDIPPIHLSKYRIEPQIAHLIPEQMARQYHLIPISKISNRLVVAMSDPMNVFALDDLHSITGFDIDPVLATEKEILTCIESIYSKEDERLSRLIGESLKKREVVEEEEIDVGYLTDESQKPPIVKMVDLIISEAIRRRASDIHIEPCQDVLRIRYRIDGNLIETLKLPRENQNAILARMKIMSGLDITESRLPQDGRFGVTTEGREIDFRVSILPIIFGGKVVMRILDKSSLASGLGSLGFSKVPLTLIENTIHKPYGMFLVTGPTGSGKSTTLYSIIKLLNTIERHIVTIEDPVEYEIEGITQIHVNPEIGLTFANGLRSILRQSPDVIMVGEIRDYETADIAIKASLTGELVFSTLHTNDAAGAITRLIDMGVEPFLVAESLIIVCAQRLCRRICPDCKMPYEVYEEILKKLALDTKCKLSGKMFYKGKGCKKCNNTGYYGRMGILEVLVVDEKIRRMIVEHASSSQLKEYALSRGMKTLREDALDKFINGETTLEEVIRVTSED